MGGFVGANCPLVKGWFLGCIFIKSFFEHTKQQKRRTQRYAFCL
ncbi:hypothetical protein [Moraxella lacunata]